MSYAPSYHPSSREPTDRQAVALHYVHAMISLRGYPPTVRELCRHMGLRSTNAGADFIKALTRKGYLERDYMRARGMRVTRLARDWMNGVDQ